MSLPESPPTGSLPFEPPISPAPEFQEFWTLWREEKFWACHEALETVWRAEQNGFRKRFYQGLIHGAVAVFQHRRGNAWGAARQFKRASVKLEAMRPMFQKTNVDEFLAGIEREIGSSTKELSTKQRVELLKLEAQLRAKL